MEIKQRVIIGAVAIAGFAYFSAEVKETFNISDAELQAEVVSQTEKFAQAEKDVYEKEVTPDEPTGPHPDPDKCICEGTGKIVQGDGHISACPYHGQREEPSLEQSQESDVCGCGCGKQGCECQNQGPLSDGPFRKFRK